MESNNNHEQIRSQGSGQLKGNSQEGITKSKFPCSLFPFSYSLFPLLFVCLASRIAFMGDYLEGWDDVDFALALNEYDITRYQPHFPGYPVYIFFCSLVSKIFHNDVLALTLPGAIFGALTILPLYLLAKEMFSKEVAFVAALLFIVNPLCWLQSERPTSDSMGLFFAMLSAQLLFSSIRSQRYSITYFAAGGIVFALTLGIRLAYFPFVAVWIFALIHIWRHIGKKVAICCGIASLAFGVSLWLIPLIHHVKFTNLSENALSFTYGHFTDWGGAVGTSPHISSRLLAFFWCLLCNGFGFWWHDTPPINLIPSVIIIVAGVKALVQSSRLNQLSLFILLYIIPYSLWVLFCQNLEKPRHILPLIPILLICLSNGLVKVSPNNIFKTIIIGLLVVTLGVSSIRLIIKHKQTQPIQVQVINYITNNFDKLSTRLYCWDTKRLFDYYAPAWDARRARNINDLKYDINASLVMPETVLCTSQVEGIIPAVDGNGDKDSCMTLLKRFRTDRYIDNPCSELSLYLLNLEMNEIASADKKMSLRAKRSNLSLSASQ